jgi:hypothetical protein
MMNRSLLMSHGCWRVRAPRCRERPLSLVPVHSPWCRGRRDLVLSDRRWVLRSDVGRRFEAVSTRSWRPRSGPIRQQWLAELWSEFEHWDSEIFALGDVWEWLEGVVNEPPRCAPVPRIQLLDPSSPVAFEPGSRLLVLCGVADAGRLAQLERDLEGWFRVDRTKVVAGILFIEGSAAATKDRVEILSQGQLDDTLEQILHWVDADCSALSGEIDRLQAEAQEARRSTVDELVRLREAHRRDIAKLKESGRYQLGDILIGVVRSPRTIRTIPRRFRQLRRRTEVSVPPRPPTSPRRSLKVGAIFDEFSWSCFEHEAQLVELQPDRLGEQVAGLDLVLVESAWEGNRGAWRYSINKFADREPKPLRDLLRHAREAEVPAVFWNKEDPVNYEVFLAAAKEFPAVLTSDADCVASYVRDLGHDRVASLAFAAQPRLHNPIGQPSQPLPKACFAGAWRGDKYEGRGRDFEILLDPLLEGELVDIFDRYADHPRRDELGFPGVYRRAVRGSLPYDQMVQQYRNYAAFLNVNSVTESPTMFSRRVFEILACGTPVISTYSRGIDEMLGEHVFMPTSPEHTRSYLEEMIADPSARQRRGHLGYRHVHRHHTYRHRFDTVLEFAGLLEPGAASRPEVSVIIVSNRPDQFEHALGSFIAQTYEDRELIFVANSSAFDPEVVVRRLGDVAGARALFIDDAATLADCLNEAISIASGRYIAKFDDDDDYGPEYLADLMLTFEYSDAAIAGKRSYYAYIHELDKTVLRFPGREFSHVPAVVGGTIVFDREAVGGIRFTPVERGTDSIFLEDCRAQGLRVFSADRFNFVQHRHVDLSRHTWKIPTAQFLEASEITAAGYATQEVFV